MRGTRPETILRLHALPALGIRPLASISPPDIQRLVNSWNKGAAPRTVRRQYDVLRALMRSAVEADRLLRTPCRRIRLPARTAIDLHVIEPEGGVIDYANWRQRVWLPACQAAGLEGLTFHNLRRANATALVAEHVDIKTAQVSLGHADPRTTLGVCARARGEGIGRPPRRWQSG